NVFWNLSYNGIYKTNKAISVIEESGYTWTNEELKNRSLGEIHFLRALYYFNLVRQFCEVPLFTQPVTGKEAVDIKRSPVDEVYQLIVSDLNKAIAFLANATLIEENGRVNEGAALGLLAKVHLTTHDYGAAEDVLKKVIDSGRFALLPNYADVFNPVDKEDRKSVV